MQVRGGALAGGGGSSLLIYARDEQEVVARGLHKRAVIDVAAFARRVARKRSASA